MGFVLAFEPNPPPAFELPKAPNAELLLLLLLLPKPNDMAAVERGEGGRKEECAPALESGLCVPCVTCSFEAEVSVSACL